MYSLYFGLLVNRDKIVCQNIKTRYRYRVAKIKFSIDLISHIGIMNKSENVFNEAKNSESKSIITM